MNEALRSAAETEGNVFEIQHFSIHDGPGIRSTVFLKGCPLKCLWCHNPEGQTLQKTVMLDLSRCLNCGRCMQVCPQGCHGLGEEGHRFIAETCRHCGSCVNMCPSGAVHWVDRRMSARQVLDEVLRDREYFAASGGGITLSGGEPTLQPDFALAIFRLAGIFGLHRTLETSGFTRREVLSQLKDETDLFLYDCKETDAVLHRRFVGVELEPILDNLRWLHDHAARIILRCPIVPGCNDREDHIRAIGRLCEELPGLEGVELLPYHSLGVSKAMRLGLSQEEFIPPSTERMTKWKEILRSMGAPVKG